MCTRTVGENDEKYDHFKVTLTYKRPGQRSDLSPSYNSPPSALQALYRYSLSARTRVTSLKKRYLDREHGMAFASSWAEPTCSEQTTRTSVVSAPIACTNT